MWEKTFCSVNSHVLVLFVKGGIRGRKGGGGGESRGRGKGKGQGAQGKGGTRGGGRVFTKGFSNNLTS